MAGTASPIGTSPAGFGEVEDYGKLSKGTFGAVSSVAIDSMTGDWLVDEYGNEEAMGDVAQRVYFCVATVLKSRSIVPGFGLAAPEKLTDNVLREVEVAVKAALDPVISDGSIELKNVYVETSGTALKAYVDWYDVKAGTLHKDAI